jgi:LPXTG-motif cell wall-anchored protein
MRALKKLIVLSFLSIVFCLSTPTNVSAATTDNANHSETTITLSGWGDKVSTKDTTENKRQKNENNNQKSKLVRAKSYPSTNESSNKLFMLLGFVFIILFLLILMVIKRRRSIYEE